MADRVVDQLEAVDIDEQHRQRPRPPLQRLDGVVEAVGEQHPVRQPGERVVERLVRQLLLERSASRAPSSDTAARAASSRIVLKLVAMAPTSSVEWTSTLVGSTRARAAARSPSASAPMARVRSASVPVAS